MLEWLENYCNQCRRIIQGYKREHTHTKAVSQVRISYSLLNSEQISIAGDDQQKMAAFNALTETLVFRRKHTDKLQQQMQNF